MSGALSFLGDVDRLCGQIAIERTTRNSDLCDAGADRGGGRPALSAQERPRSGVKQQSPLPFPAEPFMAFASLRLSNWNSVYAPC